jgi:hypothetical protein
MSNIIVRRTADDSYVLEIGGETINTYNQTKMVHPWDWSDDALKNGASQRQIDTRDYEYIDDRS